MISPADQFALGLALLSFMLCIIGVSIAADFIFDALEQRRRVKRRLQQIKERKF